MVDLAERLREVVGSDSRTATASNSAVVISHFATEKEQEKYNIN